MKTLEELFKEIEEMKKIEGKTRIQMEEHIKKLIDVEVEVLGELFDISTDLIHLINTVPEPPKDSWIFIHYKGGHLREALLGYSSGDGVCLTTRLTEVQLKSYSPDYSQYTYYDFDLLSIRKLNTSR